jgi:hypothetical protein
METGLLDTVLLETLTARIGINRVDGAELSLGALLNELEKTMRVTLLEVVVVVAALSSCLA